MTLTHWEDLGFLHAPPVEVLYWISIIFDIMLSLIRYFDQHILTGFKLAIDFRSVNGAAVALKILGNKKNNKIELNELQISF